MVLLEAVNGGVTVEKVDSAVWIAVTAAVFLVWAVLIVALCVRAMSRVRARRIALGLVRRYGGHGPLGASGQQPVAPLIVDVPVILGRTTPVARRRIGLIVARHATAGDRRTRLIAGRRVR